MFNRSGAIFLLLAPLAVCLAMAAAGPAFVVKNQGYLPFADAPINYRAANLNDPVAKLERALEEGDAHLEYEPGHGYLKSVLKALRVPVSSQTLVFSKTSFQFPQIAPATPRALYYNDDIYVGQVHGGEFLEFVSFDPMQGAVFYVMDEHRVERPLFERAEVDCVQCHVAASTRNVPGVLLRSVFTRPSGYPAAGAKSFVTGQDSPLATRWGGWYVTAASGAQGSMANAIASDSSHPERLENTSLPARLDTSKYLSGSSDIVALMVLAHQTQMHNLITQVNYRTRLALYAGHETEPSRKEIEDISEQLIHYLLFTNEVHLDAPVIGDSAFAAEFAARGPRDAQGRSLRDFDLRTRIFKYPCSYLIYSESFDSIPSPAREYIYRRLFEILSGRDQDASFASLSSENRRAILEILLATKPGFPEEWKRFNASLALHSAANRQP